MSYPATPIVVTVPQIGSQAKIERIFKLFPKNAIRAISILQLSCGALAAISQVYFHNFIDIDFGFDNFFLQLILISKIEDLRWGASFAAHIGTGIWTGLFFGISGGIGLLASNKPSHCK